MLITSSDLCRAASLILKEDDILATMSGSPANPEKDNDILATMSGSRANPEKEDGIFSDNVGQPRSS